MLRLQMAVEKAQRMRAAAAGPAGAPADPSEAARPAEADTPGPARFRPVARPGRDAPDPEAAPWRVLVALDPDPALLRRNRVVTLAGGPSAAPWDLLRVRLLDEARRHGWRRIALSSARSGVGRSTASANLALSLARAPDIRGLALDLDLGNPGLGRLFGQTPVTGMATGLAEVLAGQSPFAAVARRLGARFAFGFAGPPIGEPADLLAARSAGQALAGIEADYAPDLILFDAPSLASGPAGYAALRLADAAILLAEAERSTIAEIDRAERTLAGITNVLGTVIVKARHGA